MKRIKSILVVCVTSLTLWGSFTQWAVAATEGDPALRLTDLGIHAAQETASVGWQFTPVTNIYVGYLGFYDSQGISGDGLLTSHDLAIYQGSSTTPLVSATIAAGTATLKIGNATDGFFRYTPIASTLLLSNTMYVIAAYTTASPGGDGYSANPANQTFDGRILFGDGPPDGDFGTWRLANDTSLHNPVAVGVPYDFTFVAGTPNFLIIPEPTSAVLLGVAGLLCWRRRAQHK